MDNRHHAEDVIAGWMIGGVIGLAFFVRAAALAGDVAAACEGDASVDRRVQLSESREGSDGDSSSLLCSHA